MKALKRLVTTTMLGLGLAFGAVQAQAQDQTSCDYAGVLIVLWSDGTWDAYDVYVC